MKFMMKIGQSKRKESNQKGYFRQGGHDGPGRVTSEQWNLLWKRQPHQGPELPLVRGQQVCSPWGDVGLSRSEHQHVGPTPLAQRGQGRGGRQEPGGHRLPGGRLDPLEPVYSSKSQFLWDFSHRARQAVMLSSFNKKKEPKMAKILIYEIPRVTVKLPEGWVRQS